jgi:tetratricopeptide (TPR) repeat protein
MASSAKGIARELALGLLTQHWQPQHLIPSQADSPEQLLQQCLEESIVLREEGQAALSLQLLQAAQQAGLDSPWLLDNQARALVALGQRQDARDLWLRLLQHSDAEIAQTAEAMAGMQESSLLNALGSVCAREGWVPRHLNAPSDGSLMERVLQEVIVAREANAAQLSLDLAVATMEQGWSDPWLHDNQARALVHLQREGEALVIWQGLQTHADEALAHTAREMCDLYAERVAQRNLKQRCEQLLQQGNREQAQEFLLQALAKMPQAEELRQQLANLLSKPGSDLLSQELQQREAELAVHELLLNTLEEQLSRQQR